jgi:hypothetical protein
MATHLLAMRIRTTDILLSVGVGAVPGAGRGEKVRGWHSNEWYGQELFCKVATDHFDCYLDADGGKFRLTPEGSGLRLKITGGGGTDQIVAEGSDWGEFGKPGDDDRVFLLRGPTASSARRLKQWSICAVEST